MAGFEGWRVGGFCFLWLAVFDENFLATLDIDNFDFCADLSQ